MDKPLDIARIDRDGGPAFPFQFEMEVNGELTDVTFPGMTLRAYLVGQILPVLLTRHPAELSRSRIVPMAIGLANEAIAALEAPNAG